VPLVILPAVLLIALIVAIGLLPLGLVQRYRAGTARRAARRWLASLNAATLSFSAFLFLGGAAITSFWVPNALRYSLAGLAGGCLVGILGLAITRWEEAPGSLHYTPNRFLALVIILLVTARLAYGVWRLWQGWSLGVDERAWLIESGVPGSLAAGAVVLGYSLTYWIGVSRRASRANKSPLDGRR
jgi:uncharacterized membrane protein YidH (DUF202 family)